MNSALYISFFQGQLESALEQVVHLAVQEITGSVGPTLSALLMDTASRERENHALRARLQEKQTLQGDGAERGEGARGERHEASGRSGGASFSAGGLQTDSLRLDQKRRAVGQLKVVMEQVLDFAVCELTKIVEDSFDDLLLELMKTERENRELKERVREMEEKGLQEEEPIEPQENRTESPESSEGTAAKEPTQEPSKNTNESEGDGPAVITVSQDWVPILDKVFGEKWCSDLWQIKGRSGKEECGGPGSGVSPGDVRESLSPSSQKNADLPSEIPDWLQAPAEPPDWLQAPDPQDPASDPQCTSVSSSVGEESQLKSPSMLQRLLTLPSQLLEDSEESMEALQILADPEDPAVTRSQSDPGPQRAGLDPQEEEGGGGGPVEEEEKEGEEEERGSSRSKGGKKLHVCGECGRKFGRSSLLKIHRQTHKDTDPRLHCPHCGKSFPQLSKLQAHLRTHAGKAT
ncbi:uncharacterized protein si:dkeyp-113d7.10 isoform X2 [Hoplias malabaricus]|uniref:uncharacterized protein si:dkeyp-113d7.10 isoform X2 n=1 Tax=Hoplias malabaricus TaxID=27720 RepID=UPI003462B562